jgi:hypothetical protein
VAPRTLRRKGDAPAPGPAPGETALDKPPAPRPKSAARKFVETFHGFQAGLEAALAPLKERGSYLPRRRRRWQGHMPRLARNSADALDLFPGLFPAFTISGEELRDLEEEVRQTGQFLGFLRRTERLATAIYQNRKAELCDRTMEVVEQVHALRVMPRLDDESRTMAEGAIAMIDIVLDPAQKALQKRRQNNAALRHEADSRVDEVAQEARVAQMEGHVLRGGRLTPEDVREATGPSEKYGRRRPPPLLDEK